MFWKSRRPHHDSRSKGLKSCSAGLGGSTQTVAVEDAGTGVLAMMLSTGLAALLLLASASGFSAGFADELES